jgi:16S rRNA (cytosine967-C5)-methyltransferase
LKRNPDIKIKRDHTAIVDAQNKQLALLKTLWPLLKKGGLLLYCTCSLLQEENEQVISQFHAYQSNLAIQPITQLHGFTLAAFDYGYQLYPFEGDGLYYSLMMKT